MQPWMDQREIELISSYAAGKQKMLEWGSGGSTLHFSPLVTNYFSIEHNPDWAEKLGGQMPANVDYRLVEAEWPHEGFQAAEEGQFARYTAAISDFGEAEFDLILVDGRSRVSCAIEAANFLPPKGILFFHDFWMRQRYFGRCEELLGRYHLIDAVSSSPQGLAVFERQP